MRYISTREGKSAVGAAEAIVRGLAPDGGLYAPTFYPPLTMDDIASLARLPYSGRAARVLSGYLSEFSPDALKEMCAAAYGRFDAEAVVPLRAIGQNINMLELWHGPTHAFKDVALQLLPHLMTASARAVGEAREILILVATSGDTGKAALEGFADVPGVRICVFYPQGGVSEVQRLQMATQTGGNAKVVAVRGNFDDAQTGVKRIFTDPELAARLNDRNIALSSANSINLGRLVPQIAYYISAYADLVKVGTIRAGEAINICVPTGNFGNILAASYAKNMGLPVNRLICASNANNVLSDFIRTGVYDRNRAFFLTSSPSMDILISSNLERMLFELAERDAERVNRWMADLRDTGRYQVDGAAYGYLQTLMWGGWASEEEVSAEIARVWAEDRYLIDPHTAVATRVLNKYREETGDNTPAVVASTASPYKFGRAVANALFGPEAGDADDFACCELLAARTGVMMPDSIANLREKPVRHTAVTDINDMADAIIW